MRLKSLDPQVREATALWVLLRRLGFDLAQLGVGQAADGQIMVNVLRNDGELFSVMLGPPIGGLSMGQFLGRWRDAVIGINNESFRPEEIEAMLVGTQAHSEFSQVVKGLMERGFLNEQGTPIRFTETPRPNDLVIDVGKLKN